MPNDKELKAPSKIEQSSQSDIEGSSIEVGHQYGIDPKN
jgi:hypothetical protein